MILINGMVIVFQVNHIKNSLGVLAKYKVSSDIFTICILFSILLLHQAMQEAEENLLLLVAVRSPLLFNHTLLGFVLIKVTSNLDIKIN